MIPNDPVIIPSFYCHQFSVMVKFPKSKT